MTHTHFLAVGPHCWGRAETIKEAIKVARSQAGRSAKLFHLYSCPDGTSVDQMGYLRFDANAPEPVHLGAFDRTGRAK